MNADGEKRPTLRDVAAAAGVSHMTVSRVLNGSRAVSPATAERVKEAVSRLGYRPDPVLSALAAYRVNASPAHARQSVLAFVDCDGSPYSEGVLDGAKSEAELLGYSVERVRMPRSAAQQTRLCRMLFNRGVRGILFGPPDEPWQFEGWLWPEFAAVSLGAPCHQPPLHSVCMDYFEGVFGGFGRLQAAGCQEIGLVIETAHDVRTGFQWLGGYCAAARRAGKPALIWHPGGQPGALRRWMKRNCDGILGNGGEVAEAARAAGVRVALLNDIGIGPGVPRLKLEHREIGVEGVRLLHHLVLRREFGLPAVPKRIALRGTWVE